MTDKAVKNPTVPDQTSAASASKDLHPTSSSCKECRLVGGLGLIGASSYVMFQAKKMSRPGSKSITFLFATALMGIGLARLLNLKLPFQDE